ncbi:hypothetical protein GCM10028805_22980 [Spirosoma harenae]
MRFLFFAFIALVVLFGLTACVDPIDLTLNSKVNVLVVDGTITNLPEPQIIRLNRSQADRLTGRFGAIPITKASVDVLVDSSQIITCHETVDGSYQLPSDFKGQIGHAYQLRITLADGTKYVSNQQVMPAVPPISQVSATFSSTMLPVEQQLDGGYRAGHTLFIDTKDPVDQHNYYRWDWKLWEKQSWCRSCQQGVYAVNAIPPHSYKDRIFYVSSDTPYEDCFVPVNYLEASQPPFPTGLYVYDYPCRTDCWEILYSYALNVFDDQYTNGNVIQHRPVAQIPFYDSTACLVEVRQLSLTQKAHAYFSFFQETQTANGVTQTAPSAPIGNIRNVTDEREKIVGYFTASAVATKRYWLDRTDAKGLPLGETDPEQTYRITGAQLFYSLNRRQPNPEPIYPYPNIRIWGGPPRPVTAICVSSDTRTSAKPEGWKDL